MSGITGEFLLSTSPTGQIDLLAGCPPCQGFSSLTSKYKRPDPRNNLIREMGGSSKMCPTAVMMENVPGLSRKGRELFDEFIEQLESLGYVVRQDTLQVADYGIPQSRRRLVLLAGLGFEISLPLATHDRQGRDGREFWKPVSAVIKGIRSPCTLDEAGSRGGPMALNWHVVRTLSAENRRRIKQAKPGKHWKGIPKRLRPTCHKDREAGFSNVYGRMRWDTVSPTITGGCTTFSKGRFGHPDEDRTISVYETALLQTFPKNYVIDTPYMEYACNIIGNALPCEFAKIVAEKCSSALQDQSRREPPKKTRHKRHTPCAVECLQNDGTRRVSYREMP